MQNLLNVLFCNSKKKHSSVFLIAKFRRVLNVVCFLPCQSEAGELPRKKHRSVLSYR